MQIKNRFTNEVIGELDEILRLHQLWIDNDKGGTRANLYGATLYGATLAHANLAGANLYGATLDGANLYGANLARATLDGANLARANLPNFSIIPEEGAFIGFKKLSNGTIAKLQIPADAQRTSSLVGRKCRAEFADVLEGEGESINNNPKVHYAPGLRVTPNSYDPDIRVECSHGIHFFITRREAEEYS